LRSRAALDSNLRAPKINEAILDADLIDGRPFRRVSAQIAMRSVSELCHIPRETLDKHDYLRKYADAHRCCGKSLIGSALVRFGVRQRA
jgi:hypothetical protein